MNKEDRKDLVERLRNISRGDHGRGCMGREYVCSCDYDETSWKTAEEAAAELDRLRRELEEARKALEPFSRFAGAVFSRNFNSHDDIMELDPGDGDWIALSAGDFFEARAALRSEEEGR